jgi:large subunit ribosomal protein L33
VWSAPKAYNLNEEVADVASVARNKIMLACTECKQRNYNSMKNKKNTPDRVELNKYCRFCKKHTAHRETK